ncbi:MFS transporter [Janibacter cremeus]|uniref:DHA2 family multidrug resistance protein-like MFS transporter n=1 Tax=Janibacter cremeus TaxID=1285192 RepID=A0A852VIN9_9MICO|nr:MFS transporter [Janibacter cremeus]NYF96932.1 DHA2 family multidrug resistance protein-like MFS transporter [Janibacter cremeus]
MSAPALTTAPHASAPSVRRRWAALGVLMLPVLLIAVDNTVLAFALPGISAALSPSGAQLLWIVDAYPLVLAGLLVPMGSLGDAIGRRRLLMVGGLGFAVVSAFAAFAPTAEVLIVARAAQGFFGAMLMPATLSIIRNVFTDPTERRTAIAVWAAGFAGGAALGPIVGGLLLEHFWWGSVLLLAVPVLVPLLVLGLWLVPESRDPHPGPIDPVSILLVMATMTPIVWAVKEISYAGLTGAAVVAGLVGLVSGALFVGRQLRRPHPMLDVRLFTVPAFSGALAANLLSVFSLVGFLFFISQHLQLVSGRGPLESALFLLPGLVVTIIAGLAAVWLVRVFTPATVVAGGLLLNAVGYGVVLVSGWAGSDLGLLVAFAILGAGVGMAETISNDVILSAVPAHKAGAASAVSETAYEGGAVLGTAVLGSVLTAAYRSQVVVPAEVPPAAATAARETLGGAVEVAGGLPSPLAAQLLDSARSAFDSGVVVTSSIAAILMVTAAVIAGLTLRHQPGVGTVAPTPQ